MKENFQIHIWLGLLLCLLGMSCSDDTPAKGYTWRKGRADPAT